MASPSHHVRHNMPKLLQLWSPAAQSEMAPIVALTVVLTTAPRMMSAVT